MQDSPAHAPIAFARSFMSGYSPASSANDAGTMPAAAPPSSARPPMRTPAFGAARTEH